MWSISIQVQTSAGQKSIDINEGDVLFVAGANGVGKSSLLHELARLAFTYKVEILAGHRQITMQNDDVDQMGLTIDQLSQHLKTQFEQFSRYRNAVGEMHLKSLLKRATNKETDINFSIAEMVRDHKPITEFVSRNPSIVRSINMIFGVANLKVAVVISGGRLKAVRDGNTFTIDKMSDGERSALLLVCAILAQEKESVLIIDEPERHLNPAISGPLISSAIKSRSDLGFVVASHDLELIRWLRPQRIVHVRDSKIVNLVPHGLPLGLPENRIYEFSVLNANDGVSDEIKKGIVGNKNKVLFVEGSITTDDCLLYGEIYQNWSVVSKGGWEAVVNNVRVLGEASYAWLEVAGIIDMDGRREDEKSALKLERIFCLDVPTIENVFFNEEIITLLAQEHHAFQGGDPPEDRLNAIIESVPGLLGRYRTEIVSRRVVWIANRLVSERKISFKSIMEETKNIEGINIEKIIGEEYQRFDDLITDENKIGLLSAVPLKNTGVPQRIAKLTGFENFDKMKQAVFHQLVTKSDSGEKMRRIFKQILPEI